MRILIFGAKTQSKEDTAYSPRAICSGLFLPLLSLIGPTNNCPTAIPNKQAVRLSCAAEEVVLSSFVRLGKAGRYISMDNGPMAVIEPKINASQSLLDVL